MKTRYFLLLSAIAFGFMASAQGFTVVKTSPSLNVSRLGHAAVGLPNGKVLVIGGHTYGFYTTNTAEIYDPTAETWTLYTVPNPHDMLAMAKLNNGKYIFMGGCSSGYGVGQSQVTTIYDPVANTFTNGPTMLTARTNATAAKLANGNVLVVGNWYNTGNAELLNVSSNQFVSVGNPPTERALPLVLPANDGSAFILGGYPIYGGTPYTSVEVYNPTTNLITSHAAEIISGETGWTTSWQASQPLIDETRLSNGNYVFLLYKTDGTTTQYRLGQFNPATKVFSFLPTTPQLPDYSGQATDWAFSVALMVDVATDYIYINGVNGSSTHGERIYIVDAQNGLLSIPQGETDFPFYVYSGSKAWVNGDILYTGGTIDGSNFIVASNLTILSPYASFGTSENTLGVGELYTYPNPVVSESFEVVLPNTECFTATLTNITGSVVQTIEIDRGVDHLEILRGDLPPGIYVIEVEHTYGTNVTRIVLQ